jgi:hypothetical protein
MTKVSKLSVEKALEKLRRSDSTDSRNADQDEKMNLLDEELSRMRAERLRLARQQRKQD